MIVPNAGKRNPYQELLVASLKMIGVNVQLPQGFFLPWGEMLAHGLPDIIHLQWQHKFFRSKRLPSAIIRTILFYLQWLVLRLAGVRFVWTVHNIVNHEKYHPGWELWACRVLARVADMLIVHCPAAVPIVSDAYKISSDKIQIIPHGHYTEQYPPAVDKQQARALLGLPVDHRIFLFFGQVRAYKGLDRLLDAFTGLTSPNIQLIVAGEPRPAALATPLSAQATADPRITTHFEFIDDDRLTAYLSACDLVILPYREALTSGAAVLAASCHRPVLMPRVGCMAEFPTQAAILYEPDQTDGLYRALKQALSAPLDRMGEAAGDYIRQFSWSSVAIKTLAVYRSVLALENKVNLIGTTEFSESRE